MVTKIGPSKGAITLKILIRVAYLFMSLYLAYRFSYYQRHFIIRYHDGNWFMLCAFAIISVSFFLDFLYTPSAVFIDDDLKVLEIRYLMLSTKTLSFFNISGYSATTIKKKNGASYGIFIYLTSGKKILLTDVDFKDYNLVEEFLINLRVKALGEEEYSAIGYLRNQLMG